VQGWLKGNPELVRAKSLAGSGTPANGTYRGSVDIENMSMAEYIKARPQLLRDNRGW
jgi:hypothetical protein